MFLIDTYNKFQPNKNVVSIFLVGERKFCVREIAPKYDWGVQEIFFPERDYEDNYTDYHLYEKEDEAEAYLKQIGGARVG
mgnify:CR=1 FL=1